MCSEKVDPARFHHAGTGGLTCCLATDCNNLQFTLKTAATIAQRDTSIIYRLSLCVVVRQHVLCVYFCGTVWFLSVAGCLSWTLSSSAFSTTLQTVAPHKTASLARSSWNTWPRWAPPRLQLHHSQSVLSIDPWFQVMLVIDAAVSHLDDLHSLEDFLLNLGRKHQAVGVNPQSFAVWATYCSLSDIYTYFF